MFFLNRVQNTVTTTAAAKETTATSTSHIAEMIIKGSNNGVLEMEKVLAHNEEFAGSPCRSLAKELIEMENANIRTLKEYL